ncbi:MAG: molybdopterin-dependent oxidoreductase [Armatimonadota bacterium]
MSDAERVFREHGELSRRYFIKLGAGALAGASLARASVEAAPPELAQAIAELEYLTRDEEFRNVGRGKPPPHELPPEKRREVGLHPDTWKLEVVPDPESNAKLDAPLSTERGTALTWNGLMRLAEDHAVRHLHVTTCLNMDHPLGMGLWEGVPLRTVVWMAKPVENVRRVFFHGYHHNDPEQLFQSSLPIGRVLEDPPGEPPVLLCYKLNGEWLSPVRGAPVRMVVPDAYGFKSIKWLNRVVLTNLFHANDTYAERNNDIDSPLKTFARFISHPETVPAGQPIPLTGLAQVGISGLSRVQVWLHSKRAELPSDDASLSKGDWKDAEVLAPPERWGGELKGGRMPRGVRGLDAASGKPAAWPMRFTLAHWAILLPGVPAGTYDLRCRTIDAAGHAQPMPRPFRKSGRNAIQRVTVRVDG